MMIAGTDGSDSVTLEPEAPTMNPQRKHTWKGEVHGSQSVLFPSNLDKFAYKTMLPLLQPISTPILRLPVTLQQFEAFLGGR